MISFFFDSFLHLKLFQHLLAPAPSGFHLRSRWTIFHSFLKCSVSSHPLPLMTTLPSSKTSTTAWQGEGAEGAEGEEEGPAALSCSTTPRTTLCTIPPAQTPAPSLCEWPASVATTVPRPRFPAPPKGRRIASTSS